MTVFQPELVITCNQIDWIHLLNQFWVSNCHCKLAVSQLVKNVWATLGAKTSIFPENIWGQLVSNFTMALIKQVACNFF